MGLSDFRNRKYRPEPTQSKVFFHLAWRQWQFRLLRFPSDEAPAIQLTYFGVGDAGYLDSERRRICSIMRQHVKSTSLMKHSVLFPIKYPSKGQHFCIILVCHEKDLLTYKLTIRRHSCISHR
ncbi:protein of unknown function [Cupriavidus taiwanensis]|nr:protein of unknown function [Cupriavidus taiwanensis]